MPAAVAVLVSFVYLQPAEAGPIKVAGDYEALVLRYECASRQAVGQRVKAVQQLASCKDPRALDFLISIYTREKNQGVVSSIISAIGCRKGERAANFLMGEFDSRRAACYKCNIVWALLSTGDSRVLEFLFSNLVGEKDRNVIKTIIAAIGCRRGERAAGFLIEEYDNPTLALYRCDIIKALVTTGDPRTLSFLFSIYTSEKDQSIVATVIQFIGRFREARATAFLMKEYDDPAAAAYKCDILGSLMQNKSERTLDFLISTYSGEKDRNAVRTIIRFIGRFREARATDFLKKEYENPEAAPCKCHIISALLQNRNSQTLDFLISIYSREKDGNVLRTIISAIGSFGDERAINFLMKEFDNPEAAANKRSIVAILLQKQDSRAFRFVTGKFASEKKDIQNFITGRIIQLKFKAAKDFILRSRRPAR